jgi:hypothetical protein
MLPPRLVPATGFLVFFWIPRKVERVQLRRALRRHPLARLAAVELALVLALALVADPLNKLRVLNSLYSPRAIPPVPCSCRTCTCSY